MSKDYPCVYWNDSKCKKFSDNVVTSWCVEGPCTSETPSNADRIRAMTDAQLVQMLTIGRGGFGCSKCTESEDCGQNCEVQCLKWLQQPAEEVDNETVGERKDGDWNG